MSDKGKERRRIKLIKPRLQLKLVGVFVGLSSLGFILQSLHVGLRLSELAASMPEGGVHLMTVLPELPLEILTVSFGMLLPLTIAVGILVTFRIAGPIYRFENYLRDAIKGDVTRPCKIRDRDEFVELCDLINEATQHLRQPAPTQQQAAGETGVNAPRSLVQSSAPQAQPDQEDQEDQEELRAAG